MLHCINWQLQCDGETYNGSMISTVASHTKKEIEPFLFWVCILARYLLRVSLTVCVWLILLSALLPRAWLKTAVGSWALHSDCVEGTNFPTGLNKGTFKGPVWSIWEQKKNKMWIIILSLVCNHMKRKVIVLSHDEPLRSAEGAGPLTYIPPFWQRDVSSIPERTNHPLAPERAFHIFHILATTTGKNEMAAVQLVTICGRTAKCH